MAGAGYKQFADGDVLTAAQVQTFLQDQAVMKFADSSARTAGLGTAVAEGMLSYLDDTDAVEVYDGSAWVGVGSDPNPGIGTNVVQAFKTNAFATTSASYVTVTDLSVSITPTTATSKMLLVASFAAAANANAQHSFSFDRGGTLIAQSTGGSTVNATYSSNINEIVTNNNALPVTLVYLDSPASASAVTYTVKARTSSGTLRVGRDNAGNYGQVSSLTVVEVAA